MVALKSRNQNVGDRPVVFGVPDISSFGAYRSLKGSAMVWRLLWQKPRPRNFKPGVQGFARAISSLVQGVLPAGSVLQTQTRPRKSALDHKLLEFSAQLHQKQRNGQPYIEAPSLYHLVTEFDRHSRAVLPHVSQISKLGHKDLIRYFWAADLIRLMSSYKIDPLNTL